MTGASEVGGAPPTGRPFATLAPMAEITDSAFRAVALEAGAAAATTEMVCAAGLVRDSKNTKPLLARLADERGFVAAQLYGHDPRELAEAARIVAALGRFQAVDFNAGCPMRRIVENGDGAALMRDPALLGRCVAALAAASAPLPLWVKTRIGTDPEHPAAALLARVCEENGSALVTMHGRFASRAHAGDPEPRFVADAVSAVRIPVVANGGVRSAADAASFLENTGAAGVAIARGAVGAPWIFGETRAALAGLPAPPPPTPTLRLKEFLRHLDLLERLSGPDAIVPAARRHLFNYFRGLPGAAAMRRRFQEARCAMDVREAARALVEELN